MATNTQDPQPGTREHFLRVAQLRRWGTIQEDVELCRAEGYFTPQFYATVIAQMERIHVRRRLKQVTTAQGWPVFGHIARAGPDGRPTRVFLQEELFGPGAYRQIVASHDSLARHHLCKAQTSRDHATARHGLPRPLCGEDEGAVGGEAPGPSPGRASGHPASQRGGRPGDGVASTLAFSDHGLSATHFG